MLPCKKIYVDSRYQTPDSESNSNFKIELPSTLYFPPNTIFHIDDICIPHTWRTVELGMNDRLYILTQYVSNPCIITLPSQQYTGTGLKDVIQAQLDTFATANIVALKNKRFIVSFNAATNSFGIDVESGDGFQFSVLTDAEIKVQYGKNYDLRSANNIFRNYKSAIHYSGAPFVCDALDLQYLHNIYISSPNLGTFTTIGVRGETDILKKIPVNSDYGYMIVDEVQHQADYLDCSKQTLKTIDFRLKDVHGNDVPMHGAHVSFSIIFQQFNPSI